jgi:hypothetical protein
MKSSSASVLACTTEHTDATVEVDLYLSDNCKEIDSLHKFPLVKKVFEK